jgi:hypothetical protein
VLSSDAVRKSLHGLAPQERAGAAVDTGLYSPEATRRTYERLAAEAGAALDEGRCTIVDATAQAGWERDLLAATARAKGALFILVEVRASDDTIRGRLEARGREPGAVSDAGWDVYLAQKARWEPVALGTWAHLVVDGNAPVDDALMQLERALHDRLRPPRML